MRPTTVLLLVCLGGLLAAPGDVLARSKHRGSSSHGAADGRRHLKKANALAGQNKCHHALYEYTKAYSKLKDPVVLFNRAECYRRLGDDARAAADYRAFLKGVPDAPNREEIEARIASLEGTPPPTEGEVDAQAEPPPEPKPRPKVEPPPEPKPRPKVELPPEAKPRPKTEPSAPPPAEVYEPPPPKVAEAPPVPKAAPPVDTGRAAPLIEAHPAPPRTEEKRKVGAARWVLLAGLVLVVAGAATAGYLLLRPRGQVIPATDLGDYRF